MPWSASLRYLPNRGPHFWTIPDIPRPPPSPRFSFYKSPEISDTAVQCVPYKPGSHKSTLLYRIPDKHPHKALWYPAFSRAPSSFHSPVVPLSPWLTHNLIPSFQHPDNTFLSCIWSAPVSRYPSDFFADTSWLYKKVFWLYLPQVPAKDFLWSRHGSPEPPVY